MTRRRMPDTTKPDPLRAPALDQLQPAGVRHGYFTRVGGVSDGIYQGLNIGTGSDDDPAKVRENRSRVAAWMGVAPERLLTAYQNHFPANAPRPMRSSPLRRASPSAPPRPIAGRCCLPTRKPG